MFCFFRLDDAICNNALKRKLYPAKCSLLLEKALKWQIEASDKLKTNVHAVEVIDDDVEIIGVEESSSLVELNDKGSELRSGVKEAIDKARRLENAAKSLLANQSA
jgi:hypothetical protein